MSPGLQLALLVAILLPAGKLVASLSSRVGIPPILGELVVGVMLGPGAVNLLHMHLFQGGEASGALLLMAQVGGLVLMFIAGLETDIDRMREASLTAFLVALSGVIWPFFLGAGVGHLLGLSWPSACFMGGALTATSVPISARTLMDAGKMASTEATVILGAAVIDDVMGLFVLAFLAASSTTAKLQAFGMAPMASTWLQRHWDPAAHHPLIVQMFVITICVGLFFWIGYGAAQKFLDPLILQLRKLSANEAVPSCIFALIMNAMGASSGIFGRSEVAVMVAVVLLTTLLTPLALRAAFNLKSDQDFEDGLELDNSLMVATPKLPVEAASNAESGDEISGEN